MYWLKNGLLGWVVLSSLWGVASIVYDILIVTIGGGVKDTISWQTQQVSVGNPVIPCALGIVVGGLTIHFFKVRDWPWFQHGQPWHFYALGFVLGAVAVAATWTQRG
jgi:hypothetical protein